MRALVAVLAAAALVAAGLIVVANGQRENAAREARVASARELAAAAIANLDVDPERSILLAMAAVDRTRSIDGSVLPDAEEALHRAVTASRIVRSVPGGAEALDWSSAGLLAAVGPDNMGMIDLQDGETGESVLAFQGPRAHITDVAFSPDGTMLATTSVDGRLMVWDVSTGNLVAGISGHGAASGPSFSGDGSIVAGAWSKGATVKVLDLSARRVIRTLRGLLGAAHTAFDPYARRIAVATENFDCNGQQWRILVIDLETRGRVVLPGSEPCGAPFVTWSPDGRFVAANDRIWDARTGKLRFTLFGHTDTVMSADWSSDSRYLVTGGFDGTARLWEITPGGARQLLSLSAQDMGNVSEVAFSPDGARVMTNGPLGPARVWDLSLAGDAEVANLPGHAWAWWFGDVGFLANGRRLVVPNGRRPMAVWDLETGQEIGAIGPPLPPWETWASEPGFDVSRDGERIAIASGDQAVSVWDTAEGEELFSVEEPRMSGFDLSASGEYLVIAQWSGIAEIFDRSGSKVGSIGVSGDLGIYAIQLSPDGHLIALVTLEPRGSGSEADQVTIWDWERDTRLPTIPTRTEIMAFDPSGTLIATSNNRKPAIYRVDSGEQVTTLPRQPGDIWTLTFSPDGSRLATGSADGTVRLFDARSGRQLLVLPGNRGIVASLAFSPDGRMLAAMTRDGPARILAVDIDDLIRIAQGEVTRSLTDEECKQYLHVDPCPTLGV